MAAFPPMTVTFDDGTEVIVQPKQRDLAGAEIAGHDFTAEGSQVQAMYAVAFAVLGRMSRMGTLPEGVTAPESLEAFRDLVDVEAVEDDEGKE